MARKRKKKVSSGGSPGWMTTFGDLMSLLLTFFILLFSMSMLNESQFNKAADSLRSSFIGTGTDSIIDGGSDFIDSNESSGYEDIDPEEVIVSENSTEDVHTIPEAVHQLYETVDGYLTEEGIETDVTISRDQEGVYIDIKEAILFDSGRATLKDSGQETIGNLAGMFELFDNEIIIEGYTDNVPSTSARFPTNWELSVERAVSVLRHLTDNFSISPERLSARGYGEYRPTVANDSSKNRAQNRRVNIVIVHDSRKEVKDGSGN